MHVRLQVYIAFSLISLMAFLLSAKNPFSSVAKNMFFKMRLFLYLTS